MMNRPLPLLFLAVCVALVAACAWTPRPFEVLRVLDGETIVVSLADGSERQIRMLGIAAPKLPRGGSPGERGGLEGQHVELVADPVADLLDGYGPLPRYVYHRGRLVNAELVRQGYVLAIRDFRYSRREEFLALEREARLAGLGAWPPRRPCAPAGRPPCTLFQ